MCLLHVHFGRQVVDKVVEWRKLSENSMVYISHWFFVFMSWYGNKTDEKV